MASWLLDPADDEPVLAADGDLEVLARRPPCRVRSTASAMTASTSTGSSSGSGSPPCSRERSISSRTSRPSRSASCAIRPAKRCDGLRVVGGVLDRLGEQRERADRRLQLVPDVGDEVAADRLDPAGLGDVLQHQRDRAGRRHGAAVQPDAVHAHQPGAGADQVAGQPDVGAPAAAGPHRSAPASSSSGTSSRLPRTMPSAAGGGVGQQHRVVGVDERRRRGP